MLKEIHFYKEVEFSLRGLSGAICNGGLGGRICFERKHMQAMGGKC